MNGKEEEIYDILYKKKEINDKTPKLRTEDEKKKLKNLSYKISKIPKNKWEPTFTGPLQIWPMVYITDYWLERARKCRLPLVF